MGALAMNLDPTSKESICSNVGLIADGMMDYYEGIRYGGTVGMFQTPYYWWQSGEAFGGLLGMWYFCENNTYHDIIYNAMIAQTGTGYDYIPANQSLTEGNDDQAFWGFTVMEAAERNFTNPPAGTPGWLALSQAVYNTMWARWDTGNCQGGLRWQIFSYNSGYNYKNTISNGGLFLMAARLARYTGNSTYGDTAEIVWEWITEIKFIDNATSKWLIYDGATVEHNCTDMTKIEWSYNYGVFLAGCAYMYNFTENSVWLERADGLLLSATAMFFNNSIMYEQHCQWAKQCNTDQRSFKSIFSRCLGLTAVLAPTTHSKIAALLEASAMGAAASCSGGVDGHTCGTDWTTGLWDGFYGLGEQMSALEVMQNLLIDQRPPPYLNQTGGSSEGNVNAGKTKTASLNQNDLTINGGDRAGAGIITFVAMAGLLGGAVWMIL